MARRTRAGAALIFQAARRSHHAVWRADVCPSYSGIDGRTLRLHWHRISALACVRLSDRGWRCCDVARCSGLCNASPGRCHRCGEPFLQLLARVACAEFDEENRYEHLRHILEVSNAIESPALRASVRAYIADDENTGMLERFLARLREERTADGAALTIELASGRSGVAHGSWDCRSANSQSLWRSPVRRNRCRLSSSRSSSGPTSTRPPARMLRRPACIARAKAVGRFARGTEHSARLSPAR